MRVTSFQPVTVPKALAWYLPSIVHAALSRAPEEASRSQVVGLVQLWSSRRVLPPAADAALHAAIRPGAPPPQLPRLAPALPLQEAAVVPSHERPVPGPEPSPAPPATAPNEQGARLEDAVTAGRLAGLVKVSIQSGAAPYTPLNLAALPRASLPPVEPARLQVRLAEFYSKLEADRQRHADSRGGAWGGHR